MNGTLTRNDTPAPATASEVAQAVTEGGFFWLDLHLNEPGPDDDVPKLLTDTFHFHPVAVEAATAFGQRARIDDYDDFVHIVTFGMSENGKNVAEVHCFVTATFIVTLHVGECPALDAVRTRIGTHHSSESSAPQVVLLFLIMDTLIDSFFPVR